MNRGSVLNLFKTENANGLMADGAVCRLEPRGNEPMPDPPWVARGVAPVESALAKVGRLSELSRIALLCVYTLRRLSA